MAKIKFNFGSNAFVCEGTEEFIKGERLNFEKQCLEVSQRPSTKVNLDDYIKRDVARATGTRIINDLQGFIEAEYERQAPRHRRDKLTELGVSPEGVSAFFEFDLKQEQERIDRIRACCAASANTGSKSE
jgi:hypothetical protein